MIIGAVADIHGNFDALRRAMERHPDIATGCASATWPAAPGRIHSLWRPSIGSREQRGFRSHRGLGGRGGRATEPALHQERNRHDVGPCGSPGWAARSLQRWYATPAAQLPHTPRDDKRRHFVREEVEACARLRGVDMLLTHEAARPFIVTDETGRDGGARRRDAGKPAINELLAALQATAPSVWASSPFVETVREGVRSVCIDRINRSYLLIDARDATSTAMVRDRPRRGCEPLTRLGTEAAAR